jgi:sulfofructose kinase
MLPVVALAAALLLLLTFADRRFGVPRGFTDKVFSAMSKLEKVDVVGVGLNATDTLIPVQHFPERGSKIEIHSANAMLGGQVASALVACQQWGLRTRYVGKLGEDHAAALHRAEFARLGIETHSHRTRMR